MIPSIGCFPRWLTDDAKGNGSVAGSHFQYSGSTAGGNQPGNVA